MAIFIIAEIGINHNGDLAIAKDLIQLAKDAGCDAVKFQKRDIDLVYTQEFLSSSRSSPWGDTQRDQKKGLELSKQDYQAIDAYCSSLGIHWFASAWDKNSQLFLRDFSCNYNKIASAMLLDLNFLNLVASEKKHTFISTGMSNLSQVEDAVKVFRQHDCSFELMHAVSTYPMRDEDANLLCIDTLRQKFGCDVGYSGHETGLAVSYAASAMGITSLERHITLDRAMYGSDQPASLEPSGLRQLVGGVRKIEQAMGDGVKCIIDAELPIAQKLRAHYLVDSKKY